MGMTRFPSYTSTMIQKKIIYIFGILLITSSIILSFSNFNNNRSFEIAKSLDIFYSLFTEVTNSYVDDIDPEELIGIAITHMLQSLDPYTTYIPQSEIERYRIMTRGEYGGIGASMGKRDSLFIITRVFKNSPAHKAGLLPGDRIVLVENRSIIGRSHEDVHELLQGQVGSIMNIGISRASESTIRDFSIERERIQIQSVPYYGMIDSVTGYIRLRSFTQNCAADVKKAHQKLIAKGANAFILDLRDNPGGLLFEAIYLSNIFIDKHERIVYTRGKNSLVAQDFFTREDALDTSSRLVVLINENSASASEIVSGAIQDLDRGIVIGKQTFGKGLVQTQKEIAHNAMLKVTISKYYIPSGRCIQRINYSDKTDGDSYIPDSLLQTFYTRNGRPVKDGAGIIPDVFITDAHITPFQQGLLQQHLFLDFIAHTYGYDDTISISPDSFSVTDELFKAFVAFCSQQNLFYNNKTTQAFSEFERQIQEEEIDMQDIVARINTKLTTHQTHLFDAQKESLKTVLGREIMQFLYFEEGAISYFLPYDPYIIEAKKYLSDSRLYASILEKK